MNRPSSVTRSKKVRLAWSSVATLCVLLLVPVYALSRMAIDWRVLFALAIAASIFAFFAYRSDKRRAEAGEWRVPETTLHVIALVGGWPGAFLAQRMFRHKTSKLSFQVVFWCVVASHQFVAIDYLMDWKLTTDAIRFVREKKPNQPPEPTAMSVTPPAAQESRQP